MNAKEIESICTIGEAVLETKTNWEELYRMRKGDLSTNWGTYKDVFSLDGKYYVSPYWTESGSWLELSAEEALKYISVGQDEGVLQDEGKDDEEFAEEFEVPDDTPSIDNCDDAGTGEGRWHGRM